MIVNFKNEILEEIHKSGHIVEDIDFITRNGVGFFAEKFWSAADFDYDNETGEQIIDPEFRVTFKDRTWLGRKLSGGREFFKYRSCLDHPICFLCTVSRNDFAKED